MECLRELDEVLGMRCLDRLGLALRRELLRRELPEQLVHVGACFSLFPRADEGPIDEPRELTERSARDSLRCCSIEASAEDRETGERALLLFREQRPGLGEDGAHAEMTRIAAAPRIGDQEIERLLHL